MSWKHRPLRARIDKRSGYTPRSRGITLMEVLIVLFVLIVIVAILLPNLGRTGGNTRYIRDRMHVRSVVQAMVIWAGNNNGWYPLPSVLDVENQTVAELGESKDTTGNILSLLVFNGTLSHETLVSWSESNVSQIQLKTDYQYTAPKSAINPANALWDPTLRGTPIDGHLYGATPGVGNNSYAHAMPIGNRRNAWQDTYSSTEAVFANRGPTYLKDDFGPTASATGKWSLLKSPGSAAIGFGEDSNTLLIHGGRTTWEGNVGYNDGRVEFVTKPNPDGLTYHRALASGSSDATSDNMFVNESDERWTKDSGPDAAPWMFDRGTNVYLRPIADRPAVWPVTVWRD